MPDDNTQTQDDAVCPKCGQKKGKNLHGSITQWISACACDYSGPAALTETSVTEDMCGDCGKRIGRGQTGSITQWLFRDDLCHCGAPPVDGLSPDTAYPDVPENGGFEAGADSANYFDIETDSETENPLEIEQEPQEDISGHTEQQKKNRTMWLLGAALVCVLAGGLGAHTYQRITATENGGLQESAHHKTGPACNLPPKTVRNFDGMFFDTDSGATEIPKGLSAAKYFEMGRRQIDLGLPNSGRALLKKAIEVGDEPIKTQVECFVRTEVPKFSIPPEVAQKNVDAFSLLTCSLSKGRFTDEIEPDLLKKPDVLEAKRQWEECIHECPKFEWPYWNLGYMYLQTGQSQKAEEMAHKILFFNPDFVGAWNLLSKAKAQQGRDKEAKEYAAKARALNPSPNNPYNAVHSLLKMQHDDDTSTGKGFGFE